MSRALFGLACGVVLALTFALGILVGRQWARSTPPPWDDEYAERWRDADSSGLAGADDAGRWSNRRVGPGARVAGSEPPRGQRPSTRSGPDDGAGARGRGVTPAAAESTASAEVARGRGPGAGAAARAGIGERPRGVGVPGPETAAAGAAREAGRGGLASQGAPFESGRRGPGQTGRASDDAIASEIQQKLTFYQTLTAPLAADPAAMPRARPAGVPAPPARPAAGPARPVAPPQYTVQAAAFTTREGANELRARLGGDAYVIELEGSPARYRVRVGTFGTRATADAAAARLRSDHALAAFVTVR